MKFDLASTPGSAELLFLVLEKKDTLPKKVKDLLGAALTKQVEFHLKAKDFEGEDGQMLTLFPEKGKWKRVVLLGRGERGKELPQSVEFLGAKMVDAWRASKLSNASVYLPAEDFEIFSYGVALGSYEFKRYKETDKKAVALGMVTFVTDINAAAKMHVEKVKVFADASSYVREMVNTCSGDKNPQTVADEASLLGKKLKMKVTVFDDKKLKKMGCGALYGVGQGATVGSRMVILEYRYKSKAKNPSIAFIGKGITFDSGGLNLKPSGHIEDMKLDMCGAATVLGTLRAVAEAKVPGYFLGVLCCAENALSDRSVHPGDVVQAYNGKYVEINNTDAEGRMVLADGLAYAEKHYKPERMVDLATLTGAVTVALGYHITGIMGNNQALIDEYLDCSKKMGERTWPLPLDEDFVKATKGQFSDLINATDGVRAGTIMGAAFLKNFVSDKTAWIHLDIAGSSWVEKPTPTTKYGATAVAIRSLVELAQRYSS